MALSLLGSFTFGSLAVARAMSRHFLFPRSGRVSRSSQSESLACEALLQTVQARDGVPVHFLELAGASDRPVVVNFHNNRDTIADVLSFGRMLQAQGLGVLLLEYRGYGVSAGSEPSEQGLYLDADAVLDALARRGIGPDRIVLLGTSLGTGVAAEMARRRRGRALVLVAPYTSIPALVANVAPLVPARLLVADSFDTLAKTPDIHLSTLILHGDADAVVPLWMGQTIARAIAGARFVRVQGGHHGDLFLREPDRLLGEIAAIGERW